MSTTVVLLEQGLRLYWQRDCVEQLDEWPEDLLSWLRASDLPLQGARCLWMPLHAQWERVLPEPGWLLGARCGAKYSALRLPEVLQGLHGLHECPVESLWQRLAPARDALLCVKWPGESVHAVALAGQLAMQRSPPTDDDAERALSVDYFQRWWEGAVLKLPIIEHEYPSVDALIRAALPESNWGLQRHALRRFAGIGAVLGLLGGSMAGERLLEQGLVSLQQAKPVWQISSAQKQAMEHWQEAFAAVQARAGAPDWAPWQALAQSLVAAPALELSRLRWHWQDTGYRFDLEGQLQSDSLVEGLRLWDQAVAQWRAQGWQVLEQAAPFHTRDGSLHATAQAPPDSPDALPRFALRLWRDAAQ